MLDYFQQSLKPVSNFGTTSDIFYSFSIILGKPPNFKSTHSWNIFSCLLIKSVGHIVQKNLTVLLPCPSFSQQPGCGCSVLLRHPLWLTNHFLVSWLGITLHTCWSVHIKSHQFVTIGPFTCCSWYSLGRWDTESLF